MPLTHCVGHPDSSRELPIILRAGRSHPQSRWCFQFSHNQCKGTQRTQPRAPAAHQGRALACNRANGKTAPSCSGRAGHPCLQERQAPLPKPGSVGCFKPHLGTSPAARLGRGQWLEPGNNTTLPWVVGLGWCETLHLLKAPPPLHPSQLQVVTRHLHLLLGSTSSPQGHDGSGSPPACMCSAAPGCPQWH